MFSNSFFPFFQPKDSLKNEHCKILVIGAGGLGCELLKNLSKMPFNGLRLEITLVDNDYLDQSNANRLYYMHNIKTNKPDAPDLITDKNDTASQLITTKSKVSELAKLINTNAYPKASTIVIPVHQNIFAFESDFFKEFKCVFGCVDDIDARSFVSEKCAEVNVPLFTGGTEGYAGQETTEEKGKTDCFNCSSDRYKTDTDPICSIRTIPTTTSHVVTWAKEIYSGLLKKIEARDFSEYNAIAGDNELSEKIFMHYFYEQIISLKSINSTNNTNLRPLAYPDALIYTDDLKYKSSPLNNKLSGKYKLESIRFYALNFIACIDKLILNKEVTKAEQSSLEVNEVDSKLWEDFLLAAINLRIFNYKKQSQSLEYCNQFALHGFLNQLISTIASTSSIIAGTMASKFHSWLINNSAYTPRRTYFSNDPYRSKNKYVVDKSSAEDELVPQQVVILDENGPSPRIHFINNQQTMRKYKLEVSQHSGDFNIDVQIPDTAVVVLSENWDLYFLYKEKIKNINLLFTIANHHEADPAVKALCTTNPKILNSEQLATIESYLNNPRYNNYFISQKFYPPATTLNLKEIGFELAPASLSMSKPVEPSEQLLEEYLNDPKNIDKLNKLYTPACKRTLIMTTATPKPNQGCFQCNEPVIHKLNLSKEATLKNLIAALHEDKKLQEKDYKIASIRATCDGLVRDLYEEDEPLLPCVNTKIESLLYFKDKKGDLDIQFQPLNDESFTRTEIKFTEKDLTITLKTWILNNAMKRKLFGRDPSLDEELNNLKITLLP